MSEADRALPHNPVAERAILGAVLLDGKALVAAGAILEPKDFYVEAHQLIFRAMVSLSERSGASIDAITVGDELGSDLLERARGYPYLAGLSDGLSRSPDVARYAGIVKGKAERRSIITCANDVAKSAMNGGKGLKEKVEKLSIHIGVGVGIERKDITWRTGADSSLNAASEAPPWVVEPYVVAGGITDLAGPPKGAGKTTFATHLSRAVIDGERFLGGGVQRGPVVYLTEETETTFAQAMRRAGLVGCADFHWMTRYEVARVTWADTVTLATQKAAEVGATLIVVDTAPTFMDFKGDAENSTGEVLQAMRPLQDAAAKGFAVLAIRHERKSGGPVGIAGRGSSAYAGAADIVLGLRRPQTGTRPKVRELHALSRLDVTPDLLVIELTDDGYTSRGTASSVALEDAKGAIERVAPTNAAEARTLDDLLGDVDVKVSRATLNRAAEELLEAGVLSKAGKGVKGSAFKYFLFKHSLLGEKKGKAMVSEDGKEGREPTTKADEGIDI